MKFLGPLCLTLWFVLENALALKLIEVSIPKHADVRQDAQLSCKFDVTRGKLYSVKWYKDDFEFFRFMPDSIPKIHTFPLAGVNLDVSKSNMTTITLTKLNFSSSGNYRCEVSKEAPSFETIVRNGNMTVMAYPEEDPMITGVQSRYSPGDYVIGNCTTSWSNPPSEVFWYINGHQVDSWFMEQYPLIKNRTSDLDGITLYSVTVGLKVMLEKSHFTRNNNGHVELRCVARIDDLPIRQKIIEITPDEPLMDDIQAQNRLNNAGFVLHSKIMILLIIFGIVIH